jgi:hypothetical protein
MPRVLVLLAAVLALLSGCGDDEEQQREIADLARAADTTTAAGGVRLRVRATVEVPGDRDQRLPFSMRGVVDHRQGLADLDVDLSGLSGLQGGPGRVRGRELLVGDALYMQFGRLTDQLPDGKRWLRLDLTRFGAGLGLSLEQLSQVGADPSQFVRFLRAARDVRSVAVERVRGELTTRYRATVDLRRYPDLLPPSQRKRARQALGRLDDRGQALRFPIDVWVDFKGLVRRERIVLVQGILNQRGTAKLRMTVDFLAYGRPVAVLAPPEAEVHDVIPAS